MTLDIHAANAAYLDQRDAKRLADYSECCDLCSTTEEVEAAMLQRGWDAFETAFASQAAFLD